MVYQPFHEFIEDYQGVFNLGHVSQWNYGFQLNAWLDDLVYHSFVRYSEEAVDQCWYPKKLSMPGEGLLCCFDCQGHELESCVTEKESYIKELETNLGARKEINGHQHSELKDRLRLGLS
ncbi:hypothetical protein RHMOL_Rhmol11G0070000 [Rhododendron molle]|uniref:Uncharacterized protein n=1 Tax=Rhododendron molle TaxID=49168 RepID=A0ACC0LP59_RHOML|nr:hypothetical protein RHMOL_Rhmol11G0070000 [Rhododendron molle]